MLFWRDCRLQTDGADSADEGPETVTLEEKIRIFKADPAKANMTEVEKALADLNAEIRELEVREAKAGARKRTKPPGNCRICAPNTTPAAPTSPPRK